MKTRSFLLSTLAAFMLASCSSEEAGENNIPGDDLNGKAYLSLSLKSHIATTRATTKPGTSGDISGGNCYEIYVIRNGVFISIYYICTVIIEFACS